LHGNDEEIKYKIINYVDSNSMTLAKAALNSFSRINCPERQIISNIFFNKWKNNSVVLDNWFSFNASIETEEKTSRIEKLFIEEEKELTSSRPNLDTNEFLNLANDFDKRVELERVNQRNKEAVINENLKKWKKIFFNTFMIPIIQDFMKIYEASIVIDIDSNAFKLVIFDSRINITDGVIKRMNNLYKNIDELTIKITS